MEAGVPQAQGQYGPPADRSKPVLHSSSAQTLLGRPAVVRGAALDKARTRGPPMATVAWQKAYQARFADTKFGDDAIGLFALGLQFAIDDLDSIGAEIITGGSNDKKCDLVFFDPEEGRAVVAQCYVSKKNAP